MPSPGVSILGTKKGGNVNDKPLMTIIPCEYPHSSLFSGHSTNAPLYVPRLMVSCMTETLSWPSSSPRAHSPGSWPLHLLYGPLPQPLLTPCSVIPEARRSLTLFFLLLDSLLSLSSVAFRNSELQGPVFYLTLARVFRNCRTDYHKLLRTCLWSC